VLLGFSVIGIGGVLSCIYYYYSSSSSSSSSRFIRSNSLNHHTPKSLTAATTPNSTPTSATTEPSSPPPSSPPPPSPAAPATTATIAIASSPYDSTEPHVDSHVQNKRDFPVLRNLSRRTVVTLSTLGTVVVKDESSPDGMMLILDAKAIPVLQQLVARTDLFLITQCDETDTITYPTVHTLLQNQGIFNTGFNPVKHLSCSTKIGKAHIARQLEAYIHIDVDEDVMVHLQRFTAHLLLVNRNTNRNSSAIGGLATFSNVAVGTSLQQLFQ